MTSPLGIFPDPGAETLISAPSPCWLISTPYLNLRPSPTYDHVVCKYLTQDNHCFRGKKHKIIAAVFANRQNLQMSGRLSVSLPSLTSNHGTPIGFDQFEDKSNATSREFSSAFAATLPRLVTRRGAICGDDLMQVLHAFPRPPLTGPPSAPLTEWLPAPTRAVLSARPAGSPATLSTPASPSDRASMRICARSTVQSQKARGARGDSSRPLGKNLSAG